MADEMSLDESMELCLRDFESAVRTALQSPREIFIEFGEHLGVSWELRQELLAGMPLLNWSKIPNSQKVSINSIICSVNALSARAMAGDGLDDLADPSWGAVRDAARKYEWRKGGADRVHVDL